MEPNPDLLGCYPSSKYDCTFKATLASEQQPAFRMKFDNIVIDISMTQDNAAVVNVIISETNKSQEETSSESSSEGIIEMTNKPSPKENEPSEDTGKKQRCCYIM